MVERPGGRCQLLKVPAVKYGIDLAVISIFGCLAAILASAYGASQ